jgi:hypothetical protein
MQALTSPETFLANARGSTTPDICALYDVLKTYDRGGNMNNLFESFRQFSSTWDTSSDEFRSKIADVKRVSDRKQSILIDSAFKRDHLKSRFVTAVFTLQRQGIMKVTNNGKSFQKLATNWVYT